MVVVVVVVVVVAAAAAAAARASHAESKHILRPNSLVLQQAVYTCLQYHTGNHLRC